MARGRPWSGRERLLAFRLYCTAPFGRLHQGNPDVRLLAAAIGRTPAAVAMKACNFASLDPQHRKRGVRGLGNVSVADRRLWEAFARDPLRVGACCERAWRRLERRQAGAGADEPADESWDGATERLALQRRRLAQGFFRATVLSGYGWRCALSGIAVPELLTASHIVPWRICESRRTDPRNGVALNALHDRAFDRGLISLDERFRVMVSSRLLEEDPPTLQEQAFVRLHGRPLRMPERFAPDPDAAAWHREHVFQP